MPSTVRILLVASALLLLGACGAGKATQAPASQPAPASAAEEPEARAEIARLWDELDGWRSQAGIADGAAPTAAPAETEAATSMREPAVPGVAPAIQPPDATCPATVSEPPPCRDSCTLATSICSNAERICRLAETLAGDDWAAGKCSDAAAVCRQATIDCCDCRART